MGESAKGEFFLHKEIIEGIAVKMKPEKIRAVLRIKREQDGDPVQSYVEAAELLIWAHGKGVICPAFKTYRT